MVHGAVAAAREDGLALILVGARTVLEDELARFPEVDSLSISILDASDVVGMDEPALAVRRRPRASVRVAASRESLKESPRKSANWITSSRW